MNQEPEIRVLNASDVAEMRGMLRMFGRAFDDLPTYTGHQPGDDDMAALLANPDFIAVAAFSEGMVVGGLAAYVLNKFEQARSEVYIYDLAVEEGFRRRGIATALIRQLQLEGSERGAHAVFVQADYEDEPAVALYSKLGVREEVLHFDIEATDRSA
jgi:aminoglycoside 3-N-acetyltransferase I